MKKKLNSLQYIRAIAALMVVLYHFEFFFKVVTPSHEYTVQFFHFFGYSGVDLFFIISGIVIWLTTSNTKQPASAIQFIIRRAIRVYLPFLAILMPIFIIIPHELLRAIPNNALIKMFTLYPLPIGEHIYPIAWTLSFEILFYLAFFLLLLLKLREFLRILIVFLVFNTLLILNSYAYFHNIPDAALLISPYLPIDPVVLNYLCSPFILEFCLGIFIAYFWQRMASHPGLLSGLLCNTQRNKTITISITLLLFTGLYYFKITNVTAGFIRIVLYAPLYSLVIIFCLLDEKNRPEKYSNTLLLELGNASYLIYLFHILFLIIINNYGGFTLIYAAQFWGLVILTLLLVLMIIFCIYVSKYIEMPIYYKIVNILISRKTINNT